MGIAVEMKLVAALGLMPPVIYGCLVAIRSGATGTKRRLLVWAAAILLPILVVQLWEVVALGGWHQYVVHLGARRAYLAADDSGASVSGMWAAISSGGVLLPRARTNVLEVVTYFRGVVAPMALLILMPLIAIRIARRSARHSGDGADIAPLLLASAVVHSAWWLIFSTTGWINQLMPAFLFLAGALAFSITVPSHNILAMATWATVAVVAFPMLGLMAEYVPSRSPDTRVRDALELRHVLIATKRAGVEYLACGWWVAREIEYLLPDVGNFRDCFGVESAEFNDGHLMLVRNLDFWNWEEDARMQDFANACERDVVFRNAHYVVSRCMLPPTTRR